MSDNRERCTYHPAGRALPKVRFRTEQQARVELVGIIMARNRGKTKRTEVDVYECPKCHGWHLTSMVQPKKRVPSKDDPSAKASIPTPLEVRAAGLSQVPGRHQGPSPERESQGVADGEEREAV